MPRPALVWTRPAGFPATRAGRFLLGAMLAMAPAAGASTLYTFDPVATAAFQAGRTVLTFDELVVPPGPCYVPFVRDQYAAQGILISAFADGSGLTNLTRMPDCGHFGATLTPPNIIGGGTGPGSAGWRETIRFDFPAGATAIGASSDWTGSNTTLTAYRADGSVITSVTGNQGAFFGIAEPGIAYAIWKWNFDQDAGGFSLDNVTFSAATSAVGDPATSPLLTGAAVEPNPFDAETSFRWSLPAPARVRVGVYDLRGRLVATLLDEERPSGDGSVRWDARDDRGRSVAAGVYFVHVDVPGASFSRRVVRLR